MYVYGADLKTRSRHKAKKRDLHVKQTEPGGPRALYFIDTIPTLLTQLEYYTGPKNSCQGIVRYV